MSEAKRKAQSQDVIKVLRPLWWWLLVGLGNGVLSTARVSQAAADPTLFGGLIDAFGAAMAAALFVMWGLGYFAKSIVVTPELIVVNRWWKTTAFPTSEFIGVRQVKFNATQLQFVNGETLAPFGRQNLEAALRSAIADSHGASVDA